MEGVGQAPSARATRVRGRSPYERPLLALHPITSIPHQLQEAPYFPPPWGCIPVCQWKLDLTIHWAPQTRRTGPHTRHLGVVGVAVCRDYVVAVLATIWSENLKVYGRFVSLYFLR